MYVVTTGSHDPNAEDAQSFVVKELANTHARKLRDDGLVALVWAENKVGGVKGWKVVATAAPIVPLPKPEVYHVAVTSEELKRLAEAATAYSGIVSFDFNGKLTLSIEASTEAERCELIDQMKNELHSSFYSANRPEVLSITKVLN